MQALADPALMGDPEGAIASALGGDILIGAQRLMGEAGGLFEMAKGLIPAWPAKGPEATPEGRSEGEREDGQKHPMEGHGKAGEEAEKGQRDEEARKSGGVPEARPEALPDQQDAGEGDAAFDTPRQTARRLCWLLPTLSCNVGGESGGGRGRGRGGK